jgi:hypothetical protein
MAQQLVDKRDLDFVLWEQLDCEGLIGKGVYADFNRKSCDMVVTEARRLALKEMLPTLSEGDQVGVAWDNGAVTVPECFQRPYELLLEGSWGCLGVPDAMGGAGAPPFVAAAAAEYFMGAGWALYSYAAMGCGTAEMIEKYGTAGQREMYVKKLVSGEWGGTMLLTEPEAGSDVGALTTSAVRTRTAPTPLPATRSSSPTASTTSPTTSFTRCWPASRAIRRHQGHFHFHRAQVFGQ